MQQVYHDLRHGFATRKSNRRALPVAYHYTTGNGRISYNQFKVMRHADHLVNGVGEPRMSPLASFLMGEALGWSLTSRCFF